MAATVQVNRRRRRLWSGVLLVLLAALLVVLWTVLHAPRLPDRVLRPGESVSITGAGFGRLAGAVDFPSVDGGSTLAPIEWWSDGEIRVQVPDDATTGALRILTSQSSEPIWLQARVAASRKGVARLVARLPADRGRGSAIATVAAADAGGEPVPGLRVLVSAGPGAAETSLYLTGPDGLAAVFVTTSPQGYTGGIEAGAYVISLTNASIPGYFRGYPGGEVATARLASVTPSTDHVRVRVHLAAPDGAPLANAPVTVSANACVSAIGAGYAQLTTDNGGSASGSIRCPHPQTGVIAVDAAAPGSDDELQLEVGS
ncbi:MAG TPA: hypothetical protein VET65_00285 [Candidatus Limnocylindrales bacterium]|nr:hypothetical protein [Candidatus Limnocylindrales bacterium]